MNSPISSSHLSVDAKANIGGKVWLIGAGPGDPELLTVKAARQLQRCTIWLVDDLVGEPILELANPQTRIIPVGKRGGCVSTSQQFILRLMARYARQGHEVARLKGGDPFIFGRGGEEMNWLTEHGIQVEALSGITAGLAVGSALGLPLTHRGYSRGVVLVTAHTADGGQPAWEALAASGLSIVCYMGMSHIDVLSRRLLAAGFAADLPVAVVQNVSSATQRHLITKLSSLAQQVQAQGLGSPSVIVLGEVVSLAQRRKDMQIGVLKLAGLQTEQCTATLAGAVDYLGTDWFTLGARRKSKSTP